MQRLNLQTSNRLYARAAQVVPGGVPGIRAPENFVLGDYPIFLDRGYGGHVVDVDGNDYIDLLCSYGPILIGHAEALVDQAVARQLERGFCFNLPQVWQVELMERLVAIVPCAEMGIPLKTGSDATTAAVRIARAHTGRTKVLRCGYHGWHDWCVETGSGIPSSHREHTLAFQFNDLDQAADLLGRHRGDVAAIVVTPIGHDFDEQLEAPKAGFLEGLRHLADDTGAVLVFDEIRSGFRVANGGAQELYGVTPDLAAVGKAMGNGYAIAAVVGRRDVMRSLPEVFISSTYFPNSLEMVAACAVLDMIVDEQVVQSITSKGQTLCGEVSALIDRHDIPATMSPYPQMPFIHFHPALSDAHDAWKDCFYRHAIRAGLFAHPRHHGFIAFRHTDQDLSRVMQIVEDGFRSCKQQL